mgnify:FL=1
MPLEHTGTAPTDLTLVGRAIFSFAQLEMRFFAKSAGLQRFFTIELRARKKTCRKNDKLNAARSDGLRKRPLGET